MLFFAIHARQDPFPCGRVCPVYPALLAHSTTTYSAVIGSSSPASCVRCLTGKYSAISYATSISACVPCAVGSYQYTQGSTACTPCPKDTFGNSTGSFSESDCKGLSIWYIHKGACGSAIWNCMYLHGELLQDQERHCSISKMPASAQMWWIKCRSSCCQHVKICSAWDWIQ